MLFEVADLQTIGVVQSNFEQYVDDDDGYSDFITATNQYAIDWIQDALSESEYSTFESGGSKTDREKRFMKRAELHLTAYFMFKAKEMYLEDNLDSESMSGRSISKSKYNKSAMKNYFESMNLLQTLGFDVLSIGQPDVDIKKLVRV
jgi:hypothetical protein